MCILPSMDNSTTTPERPTLTRAHTTKSATTFEFSNGAKVRTTKSYPWLFVRTITHEDGTGSAAVYKGTSVFTTARREAEEGNALSGSRHHNARCRFDYHCLQFKGGEYVEVRRP